MAIVVHEQRSGVNIVRILIWLMILSVIGAVFYYIFFKKPALVEIVAPPNFQNTQELSKINLDPESVINTPAFQSLKQYITLPSPSNFGRPNPFLPF